MRAPALTARVELVLGLAFWIVAGLTAAAVTLLGSAPPPPARTAFAVYLPYALPVAALVAAWPWLRRLRLAPLLLDWLPFPLVLLTYEMLHVLVPACWGAWTIDPALRSLDRALLGSDAALLLEAWVSPALTRGMALFYASYYVMPPSLGLWWYLRGRRLAFRELMVGEAGALFLGYLGYLFLPALGPHAHFAPGTFTVPLEGNFIGDWIVARNAPRGGHFPRDVFPSLHTTNAVTLLLVAWRHERRVLVVYLPLCLGLVAATVYLRFHYVVDVAVGAALAFAWQAWVPRLVARERPDAGKAVPLRAPVETMGGRSRAAGERSRKP